MMEARGLTRQFGDLIAVNSVTLTVPRGALFGFLGALERAQLVAACGADSTERSRETAASSLPSRESVLRLYDRMDKIPFDKLAEFFTNNPGVTALTQTRR